MRFCTSASTADGSIAVVVAVAPGVPVVAVVASEVAVSGVAPGQSAVFYDGDDVIAGGIIRSGL